MTKVKKDHNQYVASECLVEMQEPGIDKPVYRRLGFNGVVSYQEMEETLSHQTRGLTGALLAAMLG
ncbi:hypothetical protein AU467_25685 [Mesorhizobium loti]|uniref:Uncharacterized protein n=1 Tax=Rhizobium loti TaxID=381 RepID=A0A101KRB3_RHILI|nr:hypothetical protein AU467_25685 [Mesorhizobium loti]